MATGNITGGNIGYGVTARQDLMTIIDGRKTPNKVFRYSADVIAPPITVDKPFGKMPKILAGDGDRYVEGARNYEGAYPTLTWRMSEDTYSTSHRGWQLGQDLVEDYENNQVLDLQQEHTRQLIDTARLYEEYRLATAVSDLTGYATANKKVISAEADNWLTSDNMRDQIITAVGDSSLLSENGYELEDLTLIMPISFMRDIVRTSNFTSSVGLENTSVDLKTVEEKRRLLTNFIGCKDTILVGGRINTAHFEADTPSFSRIWAKSKAFLVALSEGGGWDASFARTPIYSKPLLGRRDYVESYLKPEYKKSFVRLLQYDGLYINYKFGYAFSGINYTS